MFDTLAIQQAFGRAANFYDEHAQLQQIVRKECMGRMKDFWPDNAQILDVGSGTGAFTQDVKQEGSGWQVTGLDLAFGMCAVNNQRVVNANADAMPFADGGFDGVFSSLMLQWANAPSKVLREMARVTRTGGRCIVSTFTHGTLHELRDAFATLDKAPHVNEFMPPQYLSALAVHAGFMLLSGEEETMTQHYPDVVTLMRALKSIGAANKHTERQKGLMTPKKLKQLELAYRKNFGDKKGLPATWQVMVMILEKK